MLWLYTSFVFTDAGGPIERLLYVCSRAPNATDRSAQTQLEMPTGSRIERAHSASLKKCRWTVHTNSPRNQRIVLSTSCRNVSRYTKQPAPLYGRKLPACTGKRTSIQSLTTTEMDPYHLGELLTSAYNRRALYFKHIGRVRSSGAQIWRA